ncbi:MAG: hypothetical protein KDK30_16205, partial [Leptospiraceae bacterium]|nr:hypothetical protein [Leptospiraceae bacterium]
MDGIIYLEKFHFGIKQTKYLYALSDFVRGYSGSKTAVRVSRLCKEKLTDTMLKETFRRNLFEELVAFAGDGQRISLLQYCSLNEIDYAELTGSDPTHKYIILILYLREVFDLKAPMRIVEE